MSSDGDAAPTVAIGLTFGNSYSSIASTVSGDALVIANEEGDRQIPSFLSYVDGEEIHGAQAKAQLVRNPANTCGYFRDFLGKKFDEIDPTANHTSAHPQAQDSTTAFSIRDTAEDTSNIVTVTEITTRHLRRLKQSASDYLGKTVNAAVITIPTDFTSAQKDALTEASKNAGLEVLQYIHEPVAALLANDRRSVQKPGDKIVVVADLGGTRCDVAVISIKGGIYTILATAHDYNLGGAQLDEVLVEHFAKEFIKKNTTDPRKNDRSLARLRLESEAVKKALSLGATAGFYVEGLIDGVDFSTTINRTRYELLAGKVFASFLRLIEGAIVKAELDVLDIDDILLAGGTSHTPRIATNLASHFPPTTNVIAPATSANALNPSELIVRGAALQAFLIEGFEAEDVEQSTHPAVTVTPHLSHAIGVVLAGDSFKPVIAAETPLPVRRTIQFTYTGEGQDALIRLCEGIHDIKITKPDAEPKTNGAAKAETNGDDADDDDDDEDDEDDEEEEVKEKIWKVGTVLGELALKGIKKDARVTLQINVNTDLEVTVSAQEVGAGKTGVKGVVAGHEGANGVANGNAH